MEKAIGLIITLALVVSLLAAAQAEVVPFSEKPVIGIAWRSDPDSEFFGNLIITSLIAGITVGGKALGKSIGMNYSYNIVYGAAKVLSIFSRRKSNEHKDTK